MTPPEPGSGEPLRRLLSVLLVLGMLGVATELILLEHYEEWQQWLPLALLAAGLPSALAAAVRPSGGTVLALRIVMAGFVAAGVLGVWFHVTGNAEFELEMDASMAGWQLFWESARGATPALAPSAMVYLGLMGLLATWRHPARSAGDG